MDEEGVVLSVPARGAAVVRMMRTEACRGCGASGVCHPAGESEDMTAEVTDPIGVKEGQRVRLYVPPSAVLKASMAIYILPLVVFLAAAGAAQIVYTALVGPGRGRGASVLAGFLGMALTYAALHRFYRSKAGETLKPTIQAVISEERPSAECRPWE